MRIIKNYREYITLIRPYQWIKNLLIFAPLFFSGKVSITAIVLVFKAVICFCLLSSVGYIINDWIDRERDSHHHTKKNRPLCSGKISGLEAIFLSMTFVFLTIFLIIHYSYTDFFLVLLLFYFLLTTSYSMLLKHIVILEIFAVSMGFVLRVLAGGAICSIPVSSWLFMTVFFISMLISAAKRLSELNNLGKEKAVLHRISQIGYSTNYLTNMVWLCGAITLVVYALYVVERGGIVVYSVIPACYGILRFIYLTILGKTGDPIKVLFTDIQLFLTTLFFLIYIGITIYSS